jgi:hypothetical protein
MTKLFAILAVLSIAFVTMYQPDPAFAKKHPKAHYVCPACDYVADKPGACPMDKGTLVKVGDYYCKSDPSMVSSKPGKCPDGTKMVKMKLPKGKKMMMHAPM